jgi:hypothetical protein
MDKKLSKKQLSDFEKSKQAILYFSLSYFAIKFVYRLFKNV